MLKTEDVSKLLPWLTPEERDELTRLLAKDEAIWRPLPGPQFMAYHSQADILGFGGSAGGGKTDLMCGAMLMAHRRGIILRRQATQLTAIVDRLAELIGSRDGYNATSKVWRLQGQQIEFGSVPNLGDETNYQGRPHDFIGFDEATNFLEKQVRFLMGWLRTTIPGQRCRVIMAFNPPTTAEGRWVINYFAPWLDDKHANPAEPGELRWFATVDGKDTEVPSGDPFQHGDELIKPLSRTFVPSKVTDNPYLMGTGYMATLQGLPEPLRSQMLRGDFNAGMEDDAWQIIPTAWVDAAMARWEPKASKGAMDSMGVDVARGGKDATVISRRHGTWYDKLISLPGSITPDGPTVAGQVIINRRDKAPVHIDVIGCGGSPFDFLKAQGGVQTIGVNVADASSGKAKDSGLGFLNLRAELWWRMREELDPLNPKPIALPLDTELRADLCAPRWKHVPAGIQVESKDEIRKRIGRSPDKGDAVVMARMVTLKRSDDRPARPRALVGSQSWMGG